jgi:protein TonB
MLTFLKRNLVRILALTVAIVVVLQARHYFLGVHTSQRNEAQRVTLVSPRPEPPKRPPEPDPKPPDPSAAEPPPTATSEFFKFDDYAPADASPPSPGSGPGGLRDDLLGLDATGRGGADSYGLVGKRGGHEITTLGNATVGPGTGGGGPVGQGSGGPMAKFAAFGLMLKDHITNELNRHNEIRRSNYEVEVTVFIAHDGHISRVGIVKPTGVPSLDDKIRKVLGDAAAMAVTPPPDMPQPVRLRISSRGAEEAAR